MTASSFHKSRTIGLGAAAAIVVAGLGLWGYQHDIAFRADPKPLVRWEVEIGHESLAVADLEQTFASTGYDFMQVKAGAMGVPRVLVRTMPDDLSQVPEVDRRKSLFFGAVLPLALAVNEQIMAERAAVEAIAQKIGFNEALPDEDMAELIRLAKVYRVIEETPEADDIEDAMIAALAGVSPEDLVDELLLRVAPLPVSLVLAQAAEESAWGLSRFAAEGNALYGQWVWNDDLGMIPKARPAGQTHSVRAFSDIYESTLSYAHNLNTHRAYHGFRKMRANMLTATGHLDGYVLAGALTKYSGRGQAYVESLRSIMRGNGLKALDRAQFTDQITARTTVADADAPREKML